MPKKTFNVLGGKRGGEGRGRRGVIRVQMSFALPPYPVRVVGSFQFFNYGPKNVNFLPPRVNFLNSVVPLQQFMGISEGPRKVPRTMFLVTIVKVSRIPARKSVGESPHRVSLSGDRFSGFRSGLPSFSRF